MKALRFGAEGP